MATAEELIDDARGYAQGVLTEAQAALASATSTITGIGYVSPNVDAPTLDQPLDLPVIRSVPQMSDVVFDLPTSPGEAPAYQDIGAIDINGAPTSTASAPSLIMPSMPASMEAFQGQLPMVFTAMSFPDAPDQLTNPPPSEPTIVERQAPAAPNIVLPTFDAEAPIFSAVAPTDLAGKMEQSYYGASPAMVSMLDGQVDALLAKYCPGYQAGMAAMESKLTQLMAGGSGFTPDVERAVMERAKDRNLGEYRRTRDAAWADAADRGFTLPTGALLSVTAKARQAAADNNARANVELVAKQAELEQQNLQFAISTSQALRQGVLSAMLGFHGNLIQINGQALEHARSVANLLVETYNTQVKAFSAQLDAWKAEAGVYEVRLRAATALIDVYKAEIDALQALSQYDVARVNVYQARIDGMQALANVYRARIDAVVSQAQLERVKIDRYSAQVQAYSAQVQAKANEWQGYRAALDGEQLKVQIFDSQVRAEGQAAQVWKTKVEAMGEAVRAAALTNDARARQYEVRWRAYTAEVAAKGEVARTQLESDRQQLLAFQAETQAASTYAQVQATHYKAKADVEISYMGMKLQAQMGQIDSMRNFQGTLAGLSNANASMSGQLASMSLSGINTLAFKDN
jgi:hypothetical protein